MIDKKITLDYDEKGDILEVHLGEPCEAVGEEISDDVFVHYDVETSEIVGLTLLGLTHFKLKKPRPTCILNPESRTRCKRQDAGIP